MLWFPRGGEGEVQLWDYDVDENGLDRWRITLDHQFWTQHPGGS